MLKLVVAEFAVLVVCQLALAGYFVARGSRFRRALIEVRQALGEKGEIPQDFVDMPPVSYGLEQWRIASAIEILDEAGITWDVARPKQ